MSRISTTSTAKKDDKKKPIQRKRTARKTTTRKTSKRTTTQASQMKSKSTKTNASGNSVGAKTAAVRKAPTVIKRPVKSNKRISRATIAIMVVMLLALGGSTMIGLSDKGEINVSQVITSRNEAIRSGEPMVDEETGEVIKPINVPVQSTKIKKRNGGLVMAEKQIPEPSPNQRDNQEGDTASSSIATSTAATSTTTEAMATSTEATEEVSVDAETEVDESATIENTDTPETTAASSTVAE